MIDAEMLKDFTKNYTDLKNLVYVLIGMVVLNILSMLLKFGLDYYLKEREKNIHRKNLLINKTIKVQERLYSYLDGLTLYQYDESVALLNKIIEIENYVVKNKLYFEKDILKTTEKCLDYFKTLVTSYKNKNYEKEIAFLDDYVKRFNK